MHYNWNRHYDPTLGRYTQTDPLGFVDGPSVFAYAAGSPYRFADKEGRSLDIPSPIPLPPFPLPNPDGVKKFFDQCYSFLKNTLGVGSGDGEEDNFRRCQKAADGTEDDWNSFCNTIPSVVRSRVAGKRYRRMACFERTYDPPQSKKNWCYNEFGPTD